MDAPLAGLLVADLTQNVAGPTCTQILGDMGAEVVKVERPGRGDDARAWAPPYWGEESATFMAVNRSKRSLAVDMKQAEGRAVLERLQDRRQELDTRSRDIEMRESLLKAAEKRLEAKVGELKDVEARINNAMGARDKAEADRFKSIVSMYENMKGKDAARIFDRLDLKILVDVATQINPRKMSEILALMTPESAERLTVELASRASSPSKAQNADQLPKIEGKPN